MNDDFNWVLSVLRHKDNQIKHYDSLKRLIKNFERKWKDESGKYLLYSSHLRLVLKQQYTYDD